MKRLYLGRKIKAHNLLQTLTRVNRPYKDYQFGYVIDFADISKEFDKTNRAYLEELNQEYDPKTQEKMLKMFLVLSLFQQMKLVNSLKNQRQF